MPFDEDFAARIAEEIAREALKADYPRGSLVDLVGHIHVWAVDKLDELLAARKPKRKRDA